jgi:replication factor A1
MRSRVSPGEYLAVLSAKYQLDPDNLFSALVLAKEKQKSNCGKVSVETRGSSGGRTIFLLMNDTKVVAQFSIPEEFLLEKRNPIRDYARADMTRRYLDLENRRARSFRIIDLRSGMKKIELKAKVLEIAKPVLVFTRFGTYASVANAVIGDETGTIKLCLWNEQIASVSVGDTVWIKNANMSSFKGEKQLRIGKKGTVSTQDSRL